MSTLPHKVIESKTATIDTLSVTIRALHVSNKQMTLAVFRQIPILETVSFSAGKPSAIPGTYWGYVNYPIKDQGTMWGVLEHAGTLAKSCIDPLRYEYGNSWEVVKSLKDEMENWKAFMEQFDEASVLKLITRLTAEREGLQSQINRRQARFPYSDRSPDATDWRAETEKLSNRQSDIWKETMELEKSVKNYKSGSDQIKRLNDNYEAVSHHLRRTDLHNSICADFLKLPQLFIAV